MNKLLLVGVCLMAVAGCTRAPHKAIFTDGPTMESVLGNANRQTMIYTKMPHSREESIAYNSEYQPLKNVFKELENPTLELYVEPHVTDKDSYIPGFVIPFKLYEQVEFALPGEN